MQMNRDSVCARCQRADKGKEDVFLYGTANNMDPGEMPDLPELSQVEEMLIARVHVFIEVRQVRGQQYKYKGHIVNFLRDTGRVYNTLPLLPNDLDIVILRPSNTSADPRMQRQFVRDFKVRRGAVLQWLLFLRDHHAGYRDIEISQEALNRLPVDDNVIDDILLHEVEPEELSCNANGEDTEQEADEEEVPPESAAVPDLLAHDTEIEEIRQQIQPLCTYLSLPSFRRTPISEFNRSQPLLSWAFPTLYHRGQAEYTLPRERTVAFPEYVKHLIKYKDGRFARHPRFRYVVFNTIMRRQVNTRAGFFVRNRDDEEPTSTMSIDDFRTAFEDDSAESEALINSITRFSGSLRGTRPFWGGKRRQLEAFVKNLGSPHLFVTLSPADLHWDDLMQRMPQYGDWRDGTVAERLRIARNNLRDNPHIAAYWFHARFQAFKKEVLFKKFNIGRVESIRMARLWINPQPWDILDKGCSIS
jgi:hypothetical protein